MPIDRSTPNPQAIMRNNRKAQEAADARHAEALGRVDSVGDQLHADIAEGFKEMERKFAALEEANRQLAAQVGDLANTLKSVLPSLKTQQAARPTSKEESRQGG